MSLLSDIATAIKTKLGGTSINNTIPRYDGIACSLKSSGVTISDTDVVTAGGGFVGNLTGTASNATLAASATKLATARTIGGVSFDGTANINLPGVNTTGNQDTTGNAATATKLATAIKINGVDFDGTANIVAPTNLSVTNGTTEGFTIVSSSGTNVVVPTASETISGVVTTGNQTWAGIKTFSSSPIVPVPTTDFQSVPLKSTNITVNVGAGQTYTTINQALEYLSGFYPMYKKGGIIATINLKAGFVMTEQVLVSGIDLGWIRIVGEDPETTITHTALNTAFNGGYPAFGVYKGGTSPVIGQLFRFNVEKVGGAKHGLMTIGAGSSAEILSGKGFIGAGAHAIVAAQGSTINATGAIATYAGTYGIVATQGSTINATGAIATYAGTNGIVATQGSTINATGAIATYAGTYGIVADGCSTINANGADASYAVTYGIVATQGSTINANSAIIQNQATGTFRIRVVDGSTIEASGINTTGGTVSVFSQAVNTLTSNGIIYQ